MRFSMHSIYLASKALLFAVAINAIQLMSGNALAESVAYSFTTGSNPYGATPGPAGLFSSTDFVSGSFMYNAATAPNAVLGARGDTRYSGSLSALSGSVGSYSFSDPSGRTEVGNDIDLNSVVTPGLVDFLQLNFEPSMNNLVGFTVGGYTLVDIRLFWIETQLGITDFLTDQTLPATLPTFQGKLALDFVLAGSTSGPLAVFFDGLTATPIAAVPEPEIYAMLGAGLGLMGWIRRRRKLQAA